MSAVLLLVLAAAAAAWVATPLFRRDALDPEESSLAPLDELRELHARQQMLLASLRDAADDHATEKISDEDYRALEARLSAEAIDVMRRLDASEEQRQQALARQEESSRPLRHPGARRPGPHA
jgi:hypothetical protein